MALLLRDAVFIHIPKTAGQWVAHAIQRAGLSAGELGPVHASPDEMAADPRFVARSVRFAFVRDPVTWYPSMWTHRMNEAWSPIDDPAWFSDRWIARWADFTANVRASSFEEFVRRCADSYPDGWVSALYDAYTEGCTHVGRYESVADDLVRILELAGEEFDASRIRDTPHRNVRATVGGRDSLTLYSRSTIELVVTVEKMARERYGYAGIGSKAQPNARSPLSSTPRDQSAAGSDVGGPGLGATP